MVNITHKRTSLRIATAEAIVSVGSQDTIDAVINHKVPKGNVFEMAKTAGLFAVKKTADMIPDCHPLPVEYTTVNYKVDGLNIYIEMEVACIYRTGVEVEAMHGVSVVALTMYDMLKPIDKSIEIKNIRLVDKVGGKSDFKDKIDTTSSLALIISSDAIFNKEKEDKLTDIAQDFVEGYGLNLSVSLTIEDDPVTLIESIDHLNKHDLIIIAGGTGITPKDKTPETLASVLDVVIPGIGETVRSYGDERTPKSLVSRSLGGLKGASLIIALPGSQHGLKDALHALFPYLFTLLPKLKKTLRQ